MKASDKKILFCVGGFFGGVILHSYISFSFVSVFVSLVILLTLLLLYFFEKNEVYLFATLCILGIFLGLLRYSVSQPSTSNLAQFVNRKVVAEGILKEEPDEREDSTRITVSLEKVNETPVSEKILVIVPRFPRFEYGDKVQVSGTLTRPESFAGDDGKLFDYPAYLAKDDIYFMVRRGAAVEISKGNGFWLQGKLFDLKHAFVSSIQNVLGEPHASLLAGLLVGDKKSLGESVTTDFQKAGLIHIIVLSGYNITIVAESIMRVFAFLPLGAGTLLGSFGIILFALFAGAGPTVVRASIMALIALYARRIGRLYDITRAIIFAALAMIVWNPKLLVFDMSFALSFLATIGLIYFSPIFAKRLAWVPEKFGLREIVSATLATQIFVLPFILTKIGKVSLISLFSNLLVLPAVPITMFLGFLTGILGFISGTIASPIGFLAHLALSWILGVSHLSASLPFSQITIPFFPWWLAVLCYIGFGFLWHKEKTTETRSVAPSQKTTELFKNQF